MSTSDILFSALSVLSTVCAVIFGFAAFRRGNKRDIAEGAAKSASVLSEIGYIKANTDEIKAEQREQRRINTEFISRLTAVEESVRQAHKRINRLDGDITT